MNMIDTASESADGAPIAIGTSATDVHTPQSGKADDVVVVLMNATAGAVTCTVTIAGGTGLPYAVPANSQVVVGPFAARGAITAQAASGASIYALASIRR